MQILNENELKLSSMWTNNVLHISICIWIESWLPKLNSGDTDKWLNIIAREAVSHSVTNFRVHDIGVYDRLGETNNETDS